MPSYNQQVPDPGRVSYAKSGNSSDTSPLDNDQIQVLPTWNPDVVPRDAHLARIADCNHDGEYGVLNGNHPDHADRTAATLMAPHLAGEEHDRAVGPDQFARDGGSKRK